MVRSLIFLALILFYSLPSSSSEIIFKNVKNKTIVKINLDKINLRSAINLTIDDKIIGEIRSAVFSPTFNKVIGIAMIKKPYFTNKGNFDILIDSKKYVGEICDIPFV